MYEMIRLTHCVCNLLRPYQFSYVKSARIYSSIARSSVSSQSSDDLGDTNERAVNARNVISDLLKSQSTRMAVTTSLLLCSSAITLSMPYLAGGFIDIITSSSTDPQSYEYVTTTAAQLLGISMFGGVCNGLRHYHQTITSQKVINRLREKSFTHFFAQKPSYFYTNKPHDLVSRLSNDADKVGSAFTVNFFDSLRSAVQCIGGISLMIYTSPNLAAFGVFLFVPLSMSLLVIRRFTSPIAANVQSSLSKSNSAAEEFLSNFRLLFCFGEQSYATKQYSSLLRVLESHVGHGAKMNGFAWGVTQPLGYAFLILALIKSGAMIVAGDITGGQLSSFLVYTFFSTSSMSNCVQCFQTHRVALGAGQHLFTLLNTPLPSDNAASTLNVSTFTPRISLSNVFYSYRGSDEYGKEVNVNVLQGLNMTVEPGEICAIVGPSGCGKSTLLDIILRLVDPSGGSITLSDVDISKCTANGQTVSAIRRLCALVQQDCAMLDASVRENLLLGLPDRHFLSDTEVEGRLEQACTLANALSLVRNELSQGFETIVGPAGKALSGGQRQRLAIARALIRQPRILLLDEPTASLDAENERHIHDTIKLLARERGTTVLLVSHRLETVSLADRVHVMNDGGIERTMSGEEFVEKYKTDGENMLHL